jgi:hypothetical protein
MTDDNLYDSGESCSFPRCRVDSLMNDLNGLSRDVSYLVGRVDATFPELVTKADLKTSISDHKIQCKKSWPPAKNILSTKLVGAIIAALGALTAAIYFLIQQ